ncbi:MAG: ABC-2 family transporter protein [Oscillospiraceae bacterium]|jgi:ABC-2 type transport system permease protein|nr:ABC-2 family transporter protein [Oscillospiraceae bacterium]
MKKLLAIYKTCVKTALNRAAAYRLNFILSFLITLGSNILFPLVTILIYNSGASFPEWDFYEVLLIQAVFTLSHGLAGIVFNEVLWKTMLHIREGSFEIVLLKPLTPLFFLISTSFEPEFAGLLIGGGVMFGIAAAHTGIASALAIGQFLLLFAAGFAVMAGINMMMAATSFKWVGNSRIPEIFESVKNFGKYPAAVFPQIIRGLAAFIIPVSMIGFFPAGALLGRLDLTAFIAILPCFLFMLIGIWLYNHMIRLYEGVGG